MTLASSGPHFVHVQPCTALMARLHLVLHSSNRFNATIGSLKVCIPCSRTGLRPSLKLFESQGTMEVDMAHQPFALRSER